MPPLGAFILLRSVMIEVCVVALGAGDLAVGFLEVSIPALCGHGAKTVGEKIRAALFFELARSLFAASFPHHESSEQIMHPTPMHLEIGKMFEI